MFANRHKITADNWRQVLLIIEKYGLEKLITLFDKLYNVEKTQIGKNNFGLHDVVKVLYGDQRLKIRRICNENKDVIVALMKAGISVGRTDPNQLCIPFSLFLKMSYKQYNEQGRSVKDDLHIIDELAKRQFDLIRMDIMDWTYGPYNFNTYCCASPNGYHLMRKIYSDADIYVNKPLADTSYDVAANYPHVMWHYFVDSRLQHEAKWFAIAEVNEYQKRAYTSMHISTLDIDLNEVPTKEELADLNFDPAKKYIKK